MASLNPPFPDLPVLSSYERRTVQTLLFAVCAVAVFFGATLRLTVSYARLFKRDRNLYRWLVSICAILASAHTATLSADVFNLITPSGRHAGSAREQTRIYIAGLTIIAATMCVSQGFFVARLWTVTRSRTIRTISFLAWLTSTAMLIYWSVLQTQDQVLLPLLAGTVAIVGTVTHCILCVTSIFVSASLLYCFPRARPLDNPPNTLHGKVYHQISLFVECSGLLALDHTIGAVAHICSIVSTSATLTTTFFFFLFPAISVFSVIYSLNQRPPPPLPPSALLSGSKTHPFSAPFMSPAQADDPRKSFNGGGASIPEIPSEMMSISSGWGGGGIGGPFGSAVGAAIIYDPDDPQTWRGDAQRQFPSIRFNDDDDGPQLLALAPVSSRTGTIGGRSIASSAGGGGGGGLGRAASFRSLVRGGGTQSRPSLSRNGSGNDVIPRRPSFVSSYRGGVGAPVAEYDEELIGAEPTVLSLDMTALQDVKAPSSAWGPPKKEDEELYQDPDLSPSSSTDSAV